MYGYVYLTENLINGKVYIGQHKSSKYKDHYIGSGKQLKQAIQKYGKINFVTTIIEWCDSSEALNQREAYWIEYCHAAEDPNFYNVNPSVFEIALEARQVMSEKAKQRAHPGTTNGRIKINNGVIEKTILMEELSQYSGWQRGRLTKGRPAWNKGLTEEVDERVRRNAEGKRKHVRDHPIYYKGKGSGVKKGNIPWNKNLKGWNTGHPVSEETRARISAAKRKK